MSRNKIYKKPWKKNSDCTMEPFKGPSSKGKKKNQVEQDLSAN